MRWVIRGAWTAVTVLALLAGTASAEKQWLHYRALGDNEQGILQVPYVNCGGVATESRRRSDAGVQGDRSLASPGGL